MLKKYSALLLGLHISCALMYAQTDQLNSEKYWKFRNELRQNFMKIGSEDGESIPAATRKPNACVDNLDFVGNKGLLRWGDGMIFQGHYIGMLATEYKLLRNRGADATATLNELYYALNAVNRVDLNAEEVITDIDENELPLKAGALNGFYLRDDVPDIFYKNWQYTDFNCRCTEGDRHMRNNAAGSNAGRYLAKDTITDHSTPSLDQMTSLLVGLTVCKKVFNGEDIYVQPTPEDPVLNLTNEIAQIAHRLISYGKDHNWFLLNERGWPVGNGGGELAFTAYPLTLIGNNLTGIDYTTTPIRRKLPYYKVARLYFSLPPSKRPAMWDTLNVAEKMIVDSYLDTGLGLWDTGGPSNFEIYQGVSPTVIPLIPTDALHDIWNEITPEMVFMLSNDWHDDKKFNTTLPFPFGLKKWCKINVFSDYNMTIAYNLGVASGILSAEKAAVWGTSTGNYQLLLTHALLNDSEPAYGAKAFYKSLLDSMPVYGGFKFTGQTWHESIVYPEQLVWANGWGGEYKWNDPLEANSGTGHQGQFNAIDYMYLHNLYYLIYGDEIEEEYEEQHACICGDITWDDINALPVNDAAVVDVKFTLEQMVEVGSVIHSGLKSKLKYLNFCTPNSFKSFPSNELTTSYDLKQQFDDYHAMGILLDEFQTETFTVKSGGALNIESRLVICNTKTLEVEAGGAVNLAKGEILVKPNATLLIEGDVTTQQLTNIIVEPEGKIVLTNGATFSNSGKIELKEGAKLIYHEGATFAMTDNNAELILNGGDLELKENAVFTFEKSPSQSGQIRIANPASKLIAAPNTRFELNGNNATDPVLLLGKNVNFGATATDLHRLVILNGKVTLDSNSTLTSLATFTANDATFEGEAHNNGLYFYDETNISNANFNNLQLNAPLFYKNTGTFNLTLSTVNLAHGNAMATINGMGYTITHTTFNGEPNYMVNAKNTTLPSSLMHCTFNGGLGTIGVKDNATAATTVSNCTFANLYTGLHKINGKANVKCNAFTNFGYAGIVAQDNCVLDLSSNGYGGYNVFTKNAPNVGRNIKVQNLQSLLLYKGYNTFDDQGTLPLISGSVQTGEAGGAALLPIIPAKANKWNATDTPLTTADFHVYSITGVDMLVLTDSPEATSCPATDGDLDTDVGSFALFGNTHGQTVNTLHFEAVSLNEALDRCVRATKRFDNTNSNLAALELFEEVLLTYPTLKKHTETDWLVGLGVQHMKQTLYDAFATADITRAENQASFSAGVQRYVNVLNTVTAMPITAANYQQQFYWEMDKMHLYHLIGKPHVAQVVLRNVEQCGLDSTEQVYVNHWKKQLIEEQNQRAYGYGAALKDTTWVDTTKFKQAVRQNYGGFSSVIVSPNVVQLNTCKNSAREAITINQTDTESTNVLIDELEFTVYPNPTMGIFTIAYALQPQQTATLQLYNIAGAVVYSTNCPTGSQYHTINIGNQLEKGTYFYTYNIDGRPTKTGKIVLL